MENNENKKQSAEMVEKLGEKIKSQVAENKYKYLSNKINTESGFAWTLNRCIRMMVDEKIHLSSALAYLENELEGVN